jgi:WD40 repeat protein
VLDFNGNGWTAVSENIIEPIGSDEGFFDDGSINFNIIRVSDVDGDTMNELVAGGNNGRLMIWEYNNNNEHYDKIFVNPDPIDGATWALDTGEIDGDLINEIVIGRSRRYDYDSNFIVVFKFYGGTYQQVLLQPIEETSPNGIHLDRIGVEDLDGDGMAEIVAGLNGLTIYKYVPGQLQRIYNYAYGRSIEIN